MFMLLLIYLSNFHLTGSFCHENLDLPLSHVPYFLFSHPELANDCKLKKNCSYKEALDHQVCWGYEANCPAEKRFSMPTCSEKPTDRRFYHKSKEDQIFQYWREADFGFIWERKNELKVFCKPKKEVDSLLECTSYLTFCHARHLYLDFRTFDSTIPKYKETYYHQVHFNKGEFGGFCEYREDNLLKESGHTAPGFTLSSWYDELKYFSSLKFRPSSNRHCDVVVNKPTFFLKLDAGVNLYHHFCNYFNLYLTQHFISNFSKDINLIYWHPSALHNWDVSPEVWGAFSYSSLQYLRQYGNKRVCFKEAYFSFLPRMVLGLYYSTPLIGGCHSSGLFKAFSEFILHRLKIKQEKPMASKIRITFLTRSSSARMILNYNQLLKSLENDPAYQVRGVDFNYRMPFSEQVKISSSTDLFIGIHGAGLTHSLFLPDWGALFEVYNCGDPNCYKDLAELRGLKYITWSNKNKVQSLYSVSEKEHLKFHNYTFDKAEFLKLVRKAADLIMKDSRFHKNTRNNGKDEL